MRRTQCSAAWSKGENREASIGKSACAFSLKCLHLEHEGFVPRGLERQKWEATSCGISADWEAKSRPTLLCKYCRMGSQKEERSREATSRLRWAVLHHPLLLCHRGWYLFCTVCKSKNTKPIAYLVLQSKVSLIVKSRILVPIYHLYF